MKCLTVRKAAAVLCVLAGASLPAATFAHGAEKHEAPAKSGEEAQAPTAIPATAAEIWTRIDAEVAELDKAVAGGAFGEVHHHAFAVRDLVAALPGRSKSLPADKLAKVQANVKFVATVAQRLDAAGDASDKAAVQSGVAQLKKVLAGTRANY